MKFQDIKEARYSGGTMSVDDFDVGDKIILTTKMASGTERRVAKIRSVRRTYVTYKEWYVTKQDIKRHGEEIKGYLTSGQGALWPEDIGQNRYGLMHVEIVERGPQRRDGSLRLQEAKYGGARDFIDQVMDLIKEYQHSEKFSVERYVGTPIEQAKEMLTKQFGAATIQPGASEDFEYNVWTVDDFAIYIDSSDDGVWVIVEDNS